MSERNDGGSAFPVPGLSDLPNGQFLHPLAGRSLRDWFAGQALPMCMTAEVNRQECAEMAYAMADAMLVAREG